MPPEWTSKSPKRVYFSGMYVSGRIGRAKARLTKQFLKKIRFKGTSVEGASTQLCFDPLLLSFTSSPLVVCLRFPLCDVSVCFVFNCVFWLFSRFSWGCICICMYWIEFVYSRTKHIIIVKHFFVNIKLFVGCFTFLTFLTNFIFIYLILALINFNNVCICDVVSTQTYAEYKTSCEV